MLSEQISPTKASSESICSRSMDRTSPASDTLKISVPPMVLPKAASSSAIVSRRGACMRLPENSDLLEFDETVLAELELLQ